MTKQEAINIKDEILRKEGSIHICNIISIDGVVLVKDILDIIDKHIAESEEEYECRRTNSFTM